MATPNGVLGAVLNRDDFGCSAANNETSNEASARHALLRRIVRGLVGVGAREIWESGHFSRAGFWGVFIDGVGADNWHQQLEMAEVSALVDHRLARNLVRMAI